ncbi:hypothetical protein JCM19233_1792 [Vibrio astriarenae]|nr:hypothetical protein JCM19233_1792 [Vibrio sp. C7]
MFIGDSMTLSAQAIWSSGKTEDITQQASWSVTEDVALIENYS